MRAAEFERSIAGDDGVPGRRFRVYCSNIAAALVNALAVRYPITERLTGREFFSGMATEFARNHRPQSPVFARYGGELPDFIESFAPAASVPYLADVARLESAWWRAYHAEDLRPLVPDGFAAVPPMELARVRFTFLPSVSLVRSRWPIVSIWEANRSDGRLAHIDLDRGEAALVARPNLDVTVRAIAPIEADLIGLLMRNRALGEAAERCAADDPGFDLAAALGILVAGQIVSAIGKDNLT